MSSNKESAAQGDVLSYHDLYEVSCNRVGGWCVWFNGEQVGGEYGDGLRLDVAGQVICDSLTRERT